YDYQFSDHQRNPAFVKKLEQKILQNGIDPLYEKLQQVDPVQAKKIHPNNHRRVIRALEIYEATGETQSSLAHKQKKSSPYDPIFIGLEMERQLLYSQINARVEEMLEKGLISEVQQLYEQGLKDCQSMSAIGY